MFMTMGTGLKRWKAFYTGVECRLAIMEERQPVKIVISAG
jgi:hypothetical protein